MYFFYLNVSPPTHTYPLSLHDALPISGSSCWKNSQARARRAAATTAQALIALKNSFEVKYISPIAAARPSHSGGPPRSEEHTSELQSQSNLVCRLLLEKKKKIEEENLR